MYDSIFNYAIYVHANLYDVLLTLPNYMKQNTNEKYILKTRKERQANQI